MSQDGHHPRKVADDQTIDVVVFEMAAGASFDAHVHADHQLAWASEGVLTVDCGEETWVLPPTRALWIPAGVRHETKSSGPAIMRTAYINPQRSPLSFQRPTPIGASRLLAELIGYLAKASLHPAARANAEAVLFDILAPVSNSAIELRMPSDERALEVALAIIADPADGRDLAAWGDAVGASARTLARAFATTGVTFGRWRTLARLQAAAPALASGVAVSQAAMRVGYLTTSAFIAAFRRETGSTPRRYFTE
jgi:AraC-like DNA-binding protein/mannose-6-phosphate isomerase-like protein (cupin superfamily)